MSAAGAAARGPALRAWPESLQGRIALIVLVALLVVQSIQVGFYVYDRTLGREALAAESIVRRVASVVALYEGATPVERRALLRAINTRFFNVALRPAPPPLPFEAADRLTAELRSRLESELGPRPIGMRSVNTPHGRGALIALPVVGDDWLVVLARAEPADGNDAVRVAAWVVVSFAVLVLALLAAQRAARPFARLADAADRFGRDVNAAPLPETGSADVRRATRAFNRMQERLRRVFDDRTMMLAAISHDLRTVLTRLKLRADFIDDEEQRAKAGADLDEMEAMLKSSLAFARGEAASEPQRRLDLAALLQSLCDGAADAGQRVAYRGPDALTVEGRPVALRRVFSNLIDNAVRYGGEADVELAPARDAAVVATVADRGPGIPLDLREQVFTPFYRVEASRGRNTGGMGLGLSTARTLVRGHGGDVTLDGRDGGGLVVRVSLPIANP